MISLAAQSYLFMLDRLPVSERIQTIESLLKCPLEPGVRPVLRSEYLNLTDKELTDA